jgi:diacylglycerol kinase (ATP)
VKPQKTGLKRLVDAFFYSLAGLKAAWKEEAAFRQEVALSLLLIPLALYLGTSALEKALLLASWLGVPICEILNSALEAVVDRFGGEIHPLSKRAKDMGSAAVFLALLLWASVWFLILIF